MHMQILCRGYVDQKLKNKNHLPSFIDNIDRQKVLKLSKNLCKRVKTGKVQNMQKYA